MIEVYSHQKTIQFLGAHYLCLIGAHMFSPLTAFGLDMDSDGIKWRIFLCPNQLLVQASASAVRGH